MLIRNIEVFGFGCDEGSLQTIYIDVEGQLRIIDAATCEALAETEPMLDAQANYTLMPGWLDSHVHGYGGFDFADAHCIELDNIMQALANTGLSYCMATIVSLDLPSLKQTLQAIDHYVCEQQTHPRQGRCNLMGVHLEGPFIAQNCQGAHDKAVLQPRIDLPMFIDIINAAPHIHHWKMTLAPDLPGAIEFIKQVQTLEIDGQAKYVSIFIGHSNADQPIVAQAIRAGAIGFTHLGNANREVMHRSAEPICHHQLKSNVVSWALNPLTKEHFYIELIIDGTHVSDHFVTLAEQVRKSEIIPITDALGPSGLADGEYRLGTLTILKVGEKFVLKDDPTKLAGSAASFATIIDNYSQHLASHDTAMMPALYQAAVKNPRLSARLDTKHLDAKNFVILNAAGKLLLSSCNGKLREHYPDLRLTALLTNIKFKYGFFAKSHTALDGGIDIKQQPSITPSL